MTGRAGLKSYFVTGAKPTQGQFADVIDSVFNLSDDGITIAQVAGLSAALAGKLSAATGILAFRVTIPMTDSRLTNAGGVWTLVWDAALVAQFGTGEATVKILFDNGGGTFREQKDIQPVYNYTAGAVTNITLEIMIIVTFKIIITI